jgi:hypothetical protein
MSIKLKIRSSTKKNIALLCVSNFGRAGGGVEIAV